MKSLFEKNTLYLDAIPQPNEYLHRLILNDKTHKFIFMNGFGDTVNKIYTGKFTLDDLTNKLILQYEYDVNPYPTINENAYKKFNDTVGLKLESELELEFDIICENDFENFTNKYTVSFSKSPIPSNLFDCEFHKIFYSHIRQC